MNSTSRRPEWHRLAELRQDAALSLQEAATYFQLSPVNGRKSVAAWELGETVPRVRHRPQFLAYLWHGLGLKRDTQEFMAIWEMLVLAWEWEPLAEEELNRLQQSDAAEPQERSDALDPGLPAQVIEDSAPEAEYSLEITTPRYQIRWSLVVFGLLVAVALLLLARPNRNRTPSTVAPTMPSDVQLGRTPSPLPATAQAELDERHVNLGFETGDDLERWVVRGDPECGPEIVPTADAQQGRAVARFAPAGVECASIFYDGDVPMEVQSHVRFAMYLRSAVDQGTTLSVALWSAAERAADGTTGKAEGATTVFGDGWSCVEVTLPIDPQETRQVRAELYAPADRMGPLMIDGALLAFDGPPLCRQEWPRELRNPDFELSEQPLGWTLDGLPCAFDIVNDRQLAKSGDRYLTMRRAGSDCHMIFQDVEIEPGTLLHVAVWVRSVDGAPVRGRLGISTASQWHEGETVDFDVGGSGWRCVESSYVTPSGAPSLVRPTLYIDSDGTPLAIDRFMLHRGIEPLCPDGSALSNGGFEDPNTIDPWRFDGQCGNVLIDDAGAALAGKRFLRVTNREECRGLHQMVSQVTQPGDRVTFAIWIRPRISLPAKGVLQVRAIGDMQERGEQRFMLSIDRWHCVEVSLLVNNPGHSTAQALVYFETPGVDYDLDQAAFGVGPNSLCPPAITDLAFTQVDHIATMWPKGIAAVGVTGRINEELLDAAVAPTLYGWLSTEPAGAPINLDWTFARSLTSPQSHLSTVGHFMDFPLIREYEQLGSSYVNVASLPPSLAPPALVASAPMTVIPCAEGMVLCDIPEDYWARPEIEAWHDAEITSGCRGNSMPYNDRPFCPQQTLEASTAVIFLLRHMFGSDYRIERAYQGLFNDVSESYSRWAWVEEFATRYGIAPRDRCGADTGVTNFCATDYLTRRDLVRFISLVVETPDDAAIAAEFVDVPGDADISAFLAWMDSIGALPGDDPNCPADRTGRRFCPDAPAFRVDAAYWMSHIFGLVNPDETE